MNRLAQQPSLYLRQHARNPVHWFPWGKEAIEQATLHDLPLFISIGYSSCHWCHVMERESFEDPEIARILNENFVAIKVDREEHPDLDTFYMQACLLIHGHGGWPLNVFAFPDGRPFFAGTYFPPRSTPGQIGFAELLLRIVDLWKVRRKDLESDADSLLKAIQSLSKLPPPRGVPQKEGVPDLQTLEQVTLEDFDPLFGGMKGAPKFPPHETLETWYHLMIHRKGSDRVPRALRLTLDRINFGALRDPITGGYHRYCVDEAWRIPHFEKMLYDQAGFLHHLSHAFQTLGDPMDLLCLDQLLEELSSLWVTPTGLYASAFDADDPGGEGYFYTFTRKEILEALGKEEGERVCDWFRIEREGPVEGRSTLYPLGRPDDLVRTLPFTGGEPFLPWFEEVRKKLKTIRDSRTPPARDDKGILAQNAYLLMGLAEVLRTPLAGKVRPQLMGLAERLLQISQSSPELPRIVYPEGPRGEGGLTEYAFLSFAFLKVGLMLDDPRFIAESWALLDRAITRFFSRGRQWEDPSPELPWASRGGYWDGEIPPTCGVLLELLGAFMILAPDRYQEPFFSLMATLLPLRVEHPRGLQGITRSVWICSHALSTLLLPSLPPFDPLPLLPPSTLPLFPKTLHWLQEIQSPLLEGKDDPSFAYLCTTQSCEPPIPLTNLTDTLRARFATIG